MMNIVPIQTLDDPRLRPYRTLRQPVEHQRNGIFVAEGEKVVRRFVESSLPILSMLMTAEWLERYRVMLETKQEPFDVYVAEKKLLEGIVGFELHQGIMAIGKIPEPARLETVLRTVRRPYLFVAVDGLTNSENLGVLVRNCVAFGVQALLVGETSSSPYLRRAVRNSMGTVFKLPVVHCAGLVATLNSLHSDLGVRIVAAHPHTNERALQSTDYRGDCCVVFGSEGSGVSSEILALSEHVAIPMASGVDSLNVASASAVFLYEVMRQRRGL